MDKLVTAQIDPTGIDAARQRAEAAIASLDGDDLISRIWQDCLTGDMTPGQRKTAHLLLGYLIPKQGTREGSNSNHSDPLDRLPLDKILSIIDHIDRAIDQNSIQQAKEKENQQVRPSLTENDPSAGGLGPRGVSTLTPRERPSENAENDNESRLQAVPNRKPIL